MLRKLRSLLVCTLIVVSARAATLNVGPGQPYTTIQSAINAANNGDTVLVAPGTYYENIDFKGKAILVTSSGGAANTIIDGGSNPGLAAVSFQSGELRSSIISNFTIQNGGLATFGSQEAGGVYVSNAAPTILSNIITNNECYGVEVNFGAALIQSNEISNTSPKTIGYCNSPGTGVYLGGNSSVGGFTHSTLVGNTIENNKGGDYAGGVVFFAAEGSTLQGNIIRNNDGEQGGALWSVNTDMITIVQNVIYNNTADGAGFDSGGALSILPPSSSVGPFIGILAGNTIVNNSLLNAAPGETATQVTLEGNLGQYVVVNNIIGGSSSSAPAFTCGTTYNYLSITPLVFDHNDIYNAAGSAYGGACPDQTGIYGNLSVDPRFTNAAAGDFQLAAGSPAIDAGNNSAPLLPLDFGNAPRVQDGTGLGYPVVDMGVFEFAGSQDAAPTILSLTPSTYYPYQGFPYGNPNASFVLTAQATSGLGVPTGPVTFYEDLISIGTVNLDSTGKATLQPTPPVPGVHAFLATYPGQGAYPKTQSVKFFVLFPKYTTTLSLTSSPNPSILGTSVLFTATVSSSDGTTPGPITLYDNSTNTTLASLTPNSAGMATFSTSSLALGYHSITATYTGDNAHNSASASVDQDVINGYATNTQLTCTPSPTPVFSNVQLNASVSSSNGTPTGSLLFLDGNTPLATDTLPLHTLLDPVTSSGTHIFTVKYQPDPTTNFGSSSATCQVQVSGLPTTSVLTVAQPSTAAGSNVTLTANVAPVTPIASPQPTGSVTFIYSYTSQALSVNLGTVPLSSAGVAVLNLTSIPSGSGTLTCTYSGDTVFTTSACTAAPIVIVAPAATSALTLSSDANPARVGQPITFTLQLTSNGVSAGAGQALTLTYNPTGTAPIVAPLVTDASGSATLNLPTGLPVGSYPITAAFNGTSTLQGSSAALTEVVTNAPLPDFALSGPGSFSFVTSGPGAASLQVSSLNGFAGSVSLSCGGNVPIYYTCGLSPSSATLAAGGLAGIALTLTPIRHTAALHVPTRPGEREAPRGLITLAALALVSFAGVRRRARMLRAVSLSLLLIAVACGVTACGGDSAIPGTPPGPYALTITATSNGATPVVHTLNVTANVIVPY
jgi:hypothetical protein